VDCLADPLYRQVPTDKKTTTASRPAKPRRRQQPERPRQDVLPPNSTARVGRLQSRSRRRTCPLVGHSPRRPLRTFDILDRPERPPEQLKSPLNVQRFEVAHDQRQRGVRAHFCRDLGKLQPRPAVATLPTLAGRVASSMLGERRLEPWPPRRREPQGQANGPADETGAFFWAGRPCPRQLHRSQSGKTVARPKRGKSRAPPKNLENSPAHAAACYRGSLRWLP
jgi:hypothetical protein